MVRLGTLPLRLLALERGASLVYTEEIVDAKLAKCARTVDARLNTIDWRSGGSIILRTCDKERGKLVVQLGTASVEMALAAISALSFDPADPLRDGIAGVDVNMGCPQRSAIAGGSGAALFADSERAEAVVCALRSALPPAIALSCKVRLHECGPEESLRRCLRLVDAGVSSIAIHARHADERSCDLARWSELGSVVTGLHARGVSVLLNGDVLDAVAAAHLRRLVPGCALMIGRGALHAANGAFIADEASALDVGDEGALDAATLALCARYAELAIEIENPPLNSSFTLQWMIHARLRERSAAAERGASTSPHAPPPPHAAPPPHAPPPPPPHARPESRLEAVAATLRGASSMGAIAAALGLESFLAAAARGEPAAPSHRYTPGYCDSLDKMSDWARAPSRAALREAHAAACAPLRTNDDFRRLVYSRAQLSAAPAAVTTGGGPAASAPAGAAATLGSESDHRAALAALAAAVAPYVRVRYFVLEEAAAEARALGYFAKAWRCRVVVGGRPFDGALRRSRWRAEQDAAKVALGGLATCPLNVAKIGKQARRRAGRRGQASSSIPDADLVP